MSLGIHFSDIGKIEPGAVFDEDFLIDHISTDTRHFSSGDTYLAIKGGRFDGHDYIDDAISSGASSVVISRKDLKVGVPSLQVDNTVITLGNIAGLYRDKQKARVIGITGSNGKTTVKGMVAHICSEHGPVTVTRENQNNTIGVPLTLLSAEKEDDVIVVEMGTSEKGEIAYLSRMVLPDISVITNISESHLEGIGSREDVFLEKSEIIRFTRPGGTVVLNSDDTFTREAIKLAGERRVLSFGFSGKADIYGEYEVDGECALVNASTPEGEISYKLCVPGKHNIANSLAAAAVCLAAGIDHDAIVAGLEKFSGVDGRLRICLLGRGVRLIDDSYNANPASTRAALDVLSGYPGRKIFVYGGMAELGGLSQSLHQDIGHMASDAGVDAMYILEGEAGPALNAFRNKKYSFDSVEQICEALGEHVKRDDVILVKGSRRYQMDRVSKFLEGAIT